LRQIFNMRLEFLYFFIRILKGDSKLFQLHHLICFAPSGK
jgi:hypothetical protein